MKKWIWRSKSGIEMDLRDTLKRGINIKPIDSNEIGDDCVCSINLEKGLENILKEMKEIQHKLNTGDLIIIDTVLEKEKSIIDKVEFYKWLSDRGYHIYRDSNIFRDDKFITTFDEYEIGDPDAGEIDRTIKEIQKEDNWNNNTSSFLKKKYKGKIKTYSNPKTK